MSGSPAASEVIVSQALPHLVDYLPTALWPHGESPERYISFPEEWRGLDPIHALQDSFPELASPYALRDPTYKAFVSRRPTAGVAQYHAGAHHLEIPGFNSQKIGSWQYYTPEGLNPGQSVDRTYVSVPADEAALDSLAQIGHAIGESLQVPGITLKTTKNLAETHSIVIYSDGGELATNGLKEFIDTVGSNRTKLAPATVLTALPVVKGIGVSPEVPPKFQESYRAKTGGDGVSWTQLIGMSLLTSMRFSLADESISITSVKEQRDEILRRATNGSVTYFSGILDSMGINPDSYKLRVKGGRA